MKLSTVKERALIIPMPKEETRDSGLILPEVENGDLRRGTLVSYNGKNEDLVEAVGQIVYYDANNRQELATDNEMIHIIEEKNIWGVETTD